MIMRDAQAIRFWTAFVVLVVLNGAGWVWMRGGFASERPQPMVRLIHAGGAADLGEAGQLPLRFDRDLFVQDSVGSTLIAPPFQIDPPTPGRWRVQAPDELTFEPLTPPQPGRIYRITRFEEHPIFTRFEVMSDDLPEIRYRPLQWLTSRVDTIERDSTADSHLFRVGIELIFNQDVTPDALREALELTVNARVNEVDFKTEQAGRSHLIETLAGSGASIEVALSEGLTGKGGTLGLEAATTRRHSVPTALKPTSFDHRTGGFEDGEATLRFNRRLSPREDLGGITISPEVEGVRTRLDGNRIRINGDFRPGTHYTLEVRPPLAGVDGTELEETVRRSFITGNRPLDLEFERQAGHLSPDGGFSLDVRHVNVRSSTLSIHRLPERNVPLYLGGLDRERHVTRLGELVAKRELVLDEDGSQDPMHSVIELDGLIDRTPGIYLVTFDVPGLPWWRTPSTMVLVGDLGLHLQRDDSGYLAWTTSVRDGTPVAGVRVVAWSPNRKELVEAVSDEYGLAHLPLEHGVSVDLVTATRGAELTFLDPRDARQLDQADLAGSPWPEAVDVTMYPDRGVHRPGETIHLSGVVRSDTGQRIPELPLEIRFERPDGRTVFTRTVVPDPLQGVFHLDIPTTPSDPTGNWTATCRLPGDEKTITSLTCMVMPFVPVRLKVDATATIDPREEIEPIEVHVDAAYLHGSPASNLPAVLTAQFTPAAYKNADWSEYTFEPAVTDAGKTLRKTRTLDDDGSTKAAFERPKQTGTWLVRLQSTVREPAGRATTRTLWKTLDTANQHLGLRLRHGALHHPDAPIEAEAVILDSDGALDPSSPLTARLHEVDNHWTLHEERNGRYSWRSREVLHERPDRPPTIERLEDGRILLVIPGLERGAYRLSVDSEVTNTIDFHVASESARGRLAANRPDRLDLIAETGSHAPGSTTSVLVRAPFPGLALITVETDRILSSRVMPITEDGVRVPIHIPDSVRDTCFVGATVIRPVDPTRTEWLPVHARGAVRLKIDDAGHRLTPRLTASDGARPGETVRVALTVPELAAELELGPVRADAIAHVWAVEEGALLTTDFRAPNPLDGFFKPRRRRVVASDTADTLLPDYQRPESWARIGGDAARGHRSPVPSRMRETAVLWRKQTTIDADGVIELDLVMPDIDGAMRVMAVVIDDDRYGSTERTIAVAAPLALAGTLPRSAAPGDRMMIPVRLQNRSGTVMSTALELELDETLTGRISPSTVEIPAMGEHIALLELEAGRPSAATVRITAVPVEGSVHHPPGTLEQTIAIRPPHGRRSEVIRMQIPGETRRVIDRDHGLEDAAGRIEVLVDPNPLVELSTVLDELIDYPYGCGEQTGSRLEGLLAAKRLGSSLTDRSPSALDAMIARAIFRLHSMQTWNGGIGYWPGSNSSIWLSVRTGLLLQDARRQGYQIPSNLITGLADLAHQQVNGYQQRMTPTERAMGLRLLARENRADETVIRSMARAREELDLEALVHLADACFETGLDRLGTEALESLPLPGTMPPTSEGRFRSDLTQIAIALDILLQRLPDHPRIPELVRVLDENRSDHGWRTTYENAAAIAALARYQEQTDHTGDLEGSIRIAGTTLSFTDDEPVRFELDIDDCAALTEVIDNTGTGTAHVVVKTTGVPFRSEEAMKPLQAGMRIKRRWLDHEGEPIPEGTALASGDLVIVEIEASSRTGHPIPNVAIVEVLPGGMEFELPALATSASTDKVKLSSVDHVEFHDDRLLAFTTLKTKPTILRYVLRAIVPGDWAVPPPDALAMYDPDLKAHGTGSRLEITSP
jgi:uncharacterized protein YfaS (alpha-2-macroglobulin family)